MILLLPKSLSLETVVILNMVFLNNLFGFLSSFGWERNASLPEFYLLYFLKGLLGELVFSF